MNKVNYSKQKIFFNLGKNRYPTSAILNPPYHTQLELSQIISKLPDKLSGDIIDFGAGSGRITIPLLENGQRVLAVDISRLSLKELRKTARKIPNSQLIVSPGLSNKIPGCRAIIGADILHHIDIKDYVRQFYDVLPYGGKAIFSEPGAFNFFWYIYLPVFSSWPIEQGLKQCTYYNLLRLFKEAGFKEVKITGLGLFPRPIFNFSSFLCRLNDRLGDMPFLKPFAYRYIIEATK